MVRKLIVAGAAVAMALSTQAQTPQNPYIQPQVNVRQLPVNQGATALWQTLQKLHTRASLLMIVAHPDDEDSGMLTYEARGLGVRTGMLTLTRGEGGQNVMTGDFNDALGLIRTQELLKADEYFGIDQMFGSVVDFGFSKTMDETLANWGYDRVLCDAVRAVRVYRPLVVASVFIGGVTDGHGHHQVAGRLAQEVFTAAGDPAVCSDQIKEGLQPWQPLKVYARVPGYSISDKGIYDYATGQYAPAKFYNYITKTWSSETPSTNVVIPEGTYSPLLGMSYLQFARLGLGEQKSQNGGGSLPPAGEANVSYHRYGSRVERDKKADSAAMQRNDKSFFAGIDISLAGIATLASEDKALPEELAAIDVDVTKAMQQYSITDTAKIAPILAEGARKTSALLERVKASSLSTPEKYNVTQELLRKQALFNDALVQALGLSMRAQVASEVTNTGAISRARENADTPQAVIPGESFAVHLEVNNPSDAALKAHETTLVYQNGDGDSNSTRTLCSDCSVVANDHTFSDDFPSQRSDTQPTRPYFTRPNIKQPFYDVADRRLCGLPRSPSSLTAWATVLYDGTPITLGEVVQAQHRVVGQGVVYQPLVIVPAISVAITPQAGVIPLDAKTMQLHVTVRGDAPSADGTVKLKLPEGWIANPAEIPFHFTRRGAESVVTFTVTPQHLAAQSYTISAVVESGGKTYTEGYTTVGYPGLTPTNLYRPATYIAHGVDVQVAPNLRVAYLPGTGDDVPQSLEALGVHVHVLTMSEMATIDLKQYNEIILGVRAYNAHPDLAHLEPKLAEYAKRGGVIVTQYNKMPFSSTSQHPIAPYPFAMHFAENVVDETAPVALLAPGHPLLTWPNRITTHDFDGWVEERGHSFLGSWDAHYDALTETHDAGQNPQRGGLLFTRVGCGAYVYVAYALYRQLPEGVPGAYRLMANLLSLPKNAQAVGCAAQ